MTGRPSLRAALRRLPLLRNPAVQHRIRYHVLAPTSRLRRGRSAAAAGQPARIERYRAPGMETFGGYFDICPMSLDGRYLLAHAIPGDRPRLPEPGDTACVGYFDRRDGVFHAIDRTEAWCMQMGARLRWFPDPGSRRIAYNAIVDGRPATVIRELDASDTVPGIVPAPLYDLSRDGRTGMSVNFGRLAWMRPGYGYPALEDRGRHEPAPQDDGIWSVATGNGAVRQIVSLRDLARLDEQDGFGSAFHYVNHVSFSPSGGRVMFFHLWVPDPSNINVFRARLCFVDVDGGRLWSCMLPGRPSHCCWADDGSVCVFVVEGARSRGRFLKVEDGAGIRGPFWPHLPQADGHQTLSPDGTRMLVDSYPDRYHEQRLAIFARDGAVVELGRYRPGPRYHGELRCDLHPRWSATGSHAIFDSAHSGGRAMYVIELSHIA